MSTDLKVTVGDASLAVRIDGDAGLPWLILSNSLATDMSMWDDQIAALSQIRRVVRYDTRGHGASSSPPGPYSFEMLVGDVVAIMDHLQIQQSDVLGLSLGGMTALGLGLDHPERVRRLICSNARAIFPPAGVASWDQRAAAVASGGMAAVLDETIVRWFTEETRTGRPDVIEHARRMILTTSPDGYRSCTAALKNLDYLRRLGEFTLPVRFIAGEEDSGAPVSAMREMAEATKGAKLVVIPGAAHISNIEKADAYTTAVREFLG